MALTILESGVSSGNNWKTAVEQNTNITIESAGDGRYSSTPYKITFPDGLRIDRAWFCDIIVGSDYGNKTLTIVDEDNDFLYTVLPDANIKGWIPTKAPTGMNLLFNRDNTIYSMRTSETESLYCYYFGVPERKKIQMWILLSCCRL